MAGTTYKVDESDPRLTDIEKAGKLEIADSNETFDRQINDSNTYFQNQIDAVKDYEKTQKEEQNKQTEFAIDKIEQQKEQTRQDYIKEQSGAYTDWQKQSNAYGANAEAMAAQGMANTGYRESSQVSMYNTYQNRVATAREAYTRAVINYDNSIKEARLANSSALAKIAYESLAKQLELSLAGFQYKNELINAKTAAARQISQDYWTRYNAMYGNIHNENVLTENARQHDEEIALAQAELAWEKEKYKNEHLVGSGGGSGKGSGKGSGSGDGGSGGGSGGGVKINKKYEAPKKLDKKLTKNTSSSKATVDMNSVLKLGYGPISTKKLNSLIKEGKVKEYESNGKLKFKKVFAYK